MQIRISYSNYFYSNYSSFLRYSNLGYLWWNTGTIRIPPKKAIFTSISRKRTLKKTSFDWISINTIFACQNISWKQIIIQTRLKDQLHGSIINSRERGQVGQTSGHGTEIRTFQERGHKSGHLLIKSQFLCNYYQTRGYLDVPLWYKPTCYQPLPIWQV